MGTKKIEAIEPKAAVTMDDLIKFVYVDTDENVIEFDPVTGEGAVIEACNDRQLIESRAGPRRARAVEGLTPDSRFV
jgi:hypothetical protein